MTMSATSSSEAPPTAIARAAPASSTGERAATDPPALASDEPANSHGSVLRASCQTGTDVWAISTAV